MTLITLSGEGAGPPLLSPRVPLATDLVVVYPQGSSQGWQAQAGSLGVSGGAIANEWPDPQFCIQDQTGLTGAINDTITGTIGALSISSYTTGSWTVVLGLSSGTGGLHIGDWIQVQNSSGVDPALLRGPLQIISINPGVSVTVYPEFIWGKPASSVACTAIIVQSGQVNNGGGNVTSNVQRFANGAVWPNYWISARPAHTGIMKGCKRVLIVQKVTNGEEFIYWQSDFDQLKTLSGLSQSVGMAVYVVSPGTETSATAFVYDGITTTSGSIASAAARTWISASATMSSAATACQCGVILQGPIGTFFVLGEFTRCHSSATLPDGSFSTPRAQQIMVLASMNPWDGAAFTLPPGTDLPVVPGAGTFICNIEQMSSGTICDGVSYWTGQLEGQSQTLPANLGSNSGAAPTIFGPIMQQAVSASGEAGVPKYYAHASGNWPIRNGSLAFYGEPSVAWAFASFDLYAFTLFAGP